MKKVLICSGKGGVGKTTLTVELAKCARDMGYRVGVIDADIATPNLPVILNSEKAFTLGMMKVENDMILPHTIDGIQVVSYWFDTTQNTPHLLNGSTRVSRILRAYCSSVKWHEDTQLVFVDCPPATSDELIGLITLLNPDAAVLVTEGKTLPSVIDARRAKNTLDYYKVKVIGYVINKQSPRYSEDVDSDNIIGARCIGQVPLGRRYRGQLKIKRDRIENILEQILKEVESVAVASNR